MVARQRGGEPALSRYTPARPSWTLDARAVTSARLVLPLAAWWHFREPLLVVTPDGAPVPELVIAVVPTDRGRGVGRRLLDALVARTAHEGHDRLTLNVHLHNPAARLYSRAGFVVEGKRRGPLGVAMVRDPAVADRPRPPRPCGGAGSRRWPGRRSAGASGPVRRGSRRWRSGPRGRGCGRTW
ncbi:N-acetyltransferase [Pseudonocardia sp. MH-G8]|uniref:GNAT family N-acetyltransferase n=1 Tax=Pseudonocardia sp. MH-G8 TaxID=1854588 RepID=UPI000BA14F8D|nr:hypothetical protein CFP66_03530 [Pseudonocardia sp. MH-G8]